MAGREKNCSWYFSNQPNGQEVGPNNAMEQSFKHHPYASLVRESIQNSLDAVLDRSNPVVVKYKFKEMKGIEFPNFFELCDHIKGCLDYFPDNDNARNIYGPMLSRFGGESKYEESVGYIRISDYNTKGMSYAKDDRNSPFYAFVRSAGVSAKDSSSAGGSFGFGKAAYFLLSPIRTIIVSTCTKDYNKFFEGVSTLCTHTFRGIKKMAVGFYDDRNGCPIDDETSIPALFRRNEPGTDINVMGFDLSEIDECKEQMVKAVLRNFWMAILNDRLVVHVDDIVISKENISTLMENYFPDEDDNTRKAELINPRPYFNAVFALGQSPHCVKIEKELDILGHVSLFVNKSKGGADKIYHMRDLQMMVFAKKARTSYGFYGVFYCDSEKGNQVLRHLENPAHDEWRATNWSENSRTIPTGRDALKELESFIADSLAEVFSSHNEKAIDIAGLEEFLYIPTSADDNFESDSEVVFGKPSGDLTTDGLSYTTDIEPRTEAPDYNQNDFQNVGQVMINRETSVSQTSTGQLRSGHGEAERKSKSKGIEKPGDMKQRREETENGEHGIFAAPIDIRYRTFSQSEKGGIYHYVALHSDTSFNNVRLKFHAVGEDIEEQLTVIETAEGTILAGFIQDISLTASSKILKIRFSDNMKHAIKLTAEELYEI